MIECSSPPRRRRLVEEIQADVHPKRVGEIDLARVPLDNLWVEIRERASGEILVLYGLEERPDEQIEDAMIQLNVQRDLFVRDVRVPWVLFVHPARAMALRNRAPDFCDFVSLWLQERRSGPVAAHPRPERIFRRPPFAFEDPRLAEVARLAETRPVSEARDALSRYDLTGGSRGVDRDRAEVAVLYAEGRLADAVARLAAIEQPTANVLSDLAFVRLEQGGTRADPRHLASLQPARESWAEVERLSAAGRVDEALSVCEDLLAVQIREGDLRGQALTLYTVGELYERRGSLDEALLAHRRALRVCEELGDQRLRAALLAVTAEILRLRGEPETAPRILQREVLPLQERLGATLDRATTLGEIANLLQERGEHEAALDLYVQALAGQERFGDNHGWATTRANMAGILASAHGQPAEALRIYQEEVLPAFEQLADEHARALTLTRMGALLASLERYPEALATFEEARVQFERLQMPAEVGRLLVGVAGARWQLGERDEAIRTLRDEALARLDHPSVPLQELLEAKITLAQCLLSHDRGADRRRARELLQVARDEARARHADLAERCEDLLQRSR